MLEFLKTNVMLCCFFTWEGPIWAMCVWVFDGLRCRGLITLIRRGGLGHRSPEIAKIWPKLAVPDQIIGIFGLFMARKLVSELQSC